MKPLVIVAGPIHQDGIKQLESEARVIVSSEETEAGMIKVAQEASGILFRAKPLCTRSLMAACKELKVVGRHGVGLDTIDLPAATELGIPVVHAPGSNSNSVAEHAIMLCWRSPSRPWWWTAARASRTGARVGGRASSR